MALDAENIAEFGWALVVDLGATHHRMNARALDLRKVHAHLDREQSAGCFYEAKVNNIVNHPTCIGIEIHNAHFCRDAAVVRDGQFHGSEMASYLISEMRFFRFASGMTASASWNLATASFLSVPARSVFPSSTRAENFAIWPSA